MSHTCGTFPHPLKYACCLCCGEPVFDVLETHAEGPFADSPARIGLMTEEGTQVEFLLSDGSVAHVAFCVTCARNLRPEHYQTVWEKNVEAHDVLCGIARRTPNQRRAILRRAMRVWPVAVLKWRRQDRNLIGVVPNGLVVDRRRRDV